MRKILKKLHKAERGITGLETAIILIAFVVVASVFSYVVLSAGFLCTDQAKGTIIDGLDKVTASLEVRGSILVERSHIEVSGGATNDNNDADGTTFQLDPTDVGDGADAPDIKIVPDSERVYDGGTLETDYTIDDDTGVITFDAAPAGAVTADYSYYGVATVANGGQGAETVGVGDGAETDYNLGHYPVVAGTETIYVNGVAQTDGGVDYTLTDATGAIVFAGGSIPAADAEITAVYAYTGVTKVDYVKFTVANAVTGKSVDMIPPSVGGTTNRTVINYHDDNERDDKVTNWTVTNIGQTNGDNVLETGEQMEVKVDLNSEDLTLGTSTEFTIEIRTPQGGVVVIERVTPAALLTVNDLS